MKSERKRYGRYLGYAGLGLFFMASAAFAAPGSRFQFTVTGTVKLTANRGIAKATVLKTHHVYHVALQTMAPRLQSVSLEFPTSLKPGTYPLAGISDNFSDGSRYSRPFAGYNYEVVMGKADPGEGFYGVHGKGTLTLTSVGTSMSGHFKFSVQRFKGGQVNVVGKFENLPVRR